MKEVYAYIIKNSKKQPSTNENEKLFFACSYWMANFETLAEKFLHASLTFGPIVLPFDSVVQI